MALAKFQERLIRDLQASWQKTALLGVLLLIGLCFWVPSLLRAVSGESGRPAVAESTAATSPSPNSGSTFGKSTVRDATNAPAVATFSWQRGDELLKTDPLVRSVEVAAIQGDPFRVDHDQFPPPVLFADDARENARSKSAAAKTSEPERATSEPKAPEGLILKSTIIGVQRRAAFINTKLYFEGTEVRVHGEPYLLAAVHRRKVVLKRGGEEFELHLPAEASADNIAIDRDPQ